MTSIKGIRCSGKTTKLLYLTQGSGAVVVEPNNMMADIVRNEAIKLGLDNVKVIGMYELPYQDLCSKHSDQKYLIDEIDMFFANLNVEGYSQTV